MSQEFKTDRKPLSFVEEAKVLVDRYLAGKMSWDQFPYPDQLDDRAKGFLLRLVPRIRSGAVISVPQLRWFKGILKSQGWDISICRACNATGWRSPNTRYYKKFSVLPEHLMIHPCPECRPEEYKSWLESKTK